MFSRANRLALVMSIALPAIAIAQGFEYATGTSQYRITQKTSGTREMMGQKQEISATANQVLTAAIERPAKDTLSMTVTLDSIAAVTPMGPAMGLERFFGLKVKSKMSPAGRVYSLDGPSDETLPGASQVTDGIASFLPHIKKPLANGTTWADTTTTQVKQMGMDVDRKVIATYNVAGDTTVGAEKAWKLTRASSTMMSGSGVTPNGAVTMDGSSKSSGMFFISQKGVLLGGESAEDVNIKLMLAANGMEIGVVQNLTTKVEKVK